MNPVEERKTGRWTMPLVLVVAAHLGLAAIPLQFSTAHSQESPQVQIKLTPVKLPEPEPIAQPVEPTPQPPLPEPTPPPEPPPVMAEVPKARPVKPALPVIEEIREPFEEEVELVEADLEPVEEPLVEPVEEELPTLAKAEPRELPEEAPVVEAEPAPRAQPVDWQGYGRGILDAVNQEQRYPRMAARRGLEGTATVRIFVYRDGTLARTPDIVASTNHDLLDREALRMVESAAPFEAFPGSAEDEEQEFVIPVRFRLKG